LLEVLTVWQILVADFLKCWSFECRAF